MTVSALPSPLVLRPLNAHDVDSLLHIQTICYGNAFLESREVFSQRLTAPHHCSVGVVRAGEHTLLAYLAAYWSTLGKITPLDGHFTPATAGDPVLYLHDMSVLPDLSGQGVARYLVQHLMHQARQRGLRHAALVSVQDSQTYWERQGFSVCPVLDAQQSMHLETYGDGALYMTAAL